MSTETMSSAEIRQEAELKARELDRINADTLAILQSHPKNDSGYRDIAQPASKRVSDNELKARKLTEQLQGLNYDYLAAKAEEGLKRSTEEAFDAPQLFPAGQPESGGDAVATKARVPADLTRAFMDSRSYKAWQRGAQNQTASFELDNVTWRDAATKATLLTSTGPFTSYDRSPGLVQLGQQQLTVADLFTQATTESPVVRYIVEDTFTNAATTLAEEGQKPAVTWDLSEVDSTVRKIAVITTVTDEAFADFGQLRSYVNDRLPFMVKQREELQLLSGDGNAPNLLGVLAVPTIQTYAKAGADTNIDAIYKAMTKVRSIGFWEPDAVVINPLNWTPIRLSKETTGGYIYGDPWVPGPETIFGKRVVVTANMTANTGLVGAFKMGGTVYFRSGLRIEATNSNGSDFEYNRISLRAEERLALAVFRPTAFCTATSLVQ